MPLRIDLNVVSFMRVFVRPKSQLPFFELVKKITQSQSLTNLIKSVIRSISILFPNAASVLTRLRYEVDVVEKKPGGVLIFKNPDWRIYGYAYRMNGSLMTISIQSSISPTGDKWEEAPPSTDIDLLFQ